MFTQNDDALQAVKSLAFQHTPLGLASCFKGMHFIERVQPVQVGISHVVFRAPSPKVCLILGDTVYLYSRVLPETVRATPQLVGYSAHELRLTDFSYTGTLWHERIEQRVQPEKPVSVDLLMARRFYRASLKDISANGIGLLVNIPVEIQGDIITNTPADFTFQLNALDQFTLHGKIVHRQLIGRSLFDLGLHIFPTPTQKTWLENYISRRKQAILTELERQLAYSLEPQPVKDQYF